jgi:hypothetical protein
MGKASRRIALERTRCCIKSRSNSVIYYMGSMPRSSHRAMSGYANFVWPCMTQSTAKPRAASRLKWMLKESRCSGCSRSRTCSEKTTTTATTIRSEPVLSGAAPAGFLAAPDQPPSAERGDDLRLLLMVPLRVAVRRHEAVDPARQGAKLGGATKAVEAVGAHASQPKKFAGMPPRRRPRHHHVYGIA